MSAHSAEAHAPTGTRLFVWTWIWLLALTGVEVFLGYIHLPAHLMLTLLLGISVIKAALIIAYFMHLRFERLSLFLTLWPITVVCISLIIIFAFPDGVRLLEMGAR